MIYPVAFMCLTVAVQPLVHVDLVCESMSQSNGCKEHLDADDEVLIAGCDRTLTNRHLGGVDLRNSSTFLQDGQEHT